LAKRPFTLILPEVISALACDLDLASSRITSSMSKRSLKAYSFQVLELFRQELRFAGQSPTFRSQLVAVLSSLWPSLVLAVDARVDIK